MNLFSPVPLLPVLTAEEQAELEAVASEEVYMAAMVSILDDVCPRTPIGRRTSDRV